MRVLYVAEREADGRLVKGLRELGQIIEPVLGLGDGRQLAQDGDWQVVILDAGTIDGNTAADYRAAAPEALIIAITPTDDAQSRVEALRGGCDDVLVRPISLSEVSAKLEAMTRHRRRVRSVAADGPPAIELSAAERAVFVGHRRIGLSRREFAVLEVLVHRAGEVAPTSLILESAWGDGEESSVERLHAQVGRLRAKLEGDGPWKLIHVVRGHGYRLHPEARGRSAQTK